GPGAPRRSPPMVLSRQQASERPRGPGRDRIPREERPYGPQLFARGDGVSRRGAGLARPEPARRPAPEGGRLRGALPGRPPALAHDPRPEGLGGAGLAGGVGR